MSEMDEACFIAIEGADGCGKSTFARALAAALEKTRSRVLLEREPSGGPIGRDIRTILQGGTARPSALELANMFALDRLQHLSGRILPALQDGATVICDRYTMSSFAYNHAADGVTEKDIARLNRYATSPDHVFVLHGPEALCRARIHARGGEVELFERADALRLAWEYYERIVSAVPGPGVHVLDIRAPTEKLVEHALVILSI